MTEKRFETKLRMVIDTEKKYGARVLNAEECVDLLNKQYEENQDLATKKEDAEYELLHLKEKYEELLEENKYLKSIKFTQDCINEISICMQQRESLEEKNQQLSKDKQLAETELIKYKQRVKNELELQYCLSNHKLLIEIMANELDITLEGNIE